MGVNEKGGQEQIMAMAHKGKNQYLGRIVKESDTEERVRGGTGSVGQRWNQRTWPQGPCLSFL